MNAILDCLFIILLIFVPSGVFPVILLISFFYLVFVILERLVSKTFTEEGMKCKTS